MNRSTKLAFVAGLIAMSGLAPAQPSRQLIRELKAAKLNVMRARVRATIRITDVSGPNPRMAVTHWAWSEGKEHSRVLSEQQKSPEQREAVWDGKRGVVRYGDPAADLSASLPTPGAAVLPTKSHRWETYLSVTKSREYIFWGPIESSYFPYVVGGKGNADHSSHASWAFDIIQMPDVTVETASDGHVRLHLPNSSPFYPSGGRIIELNPSWGYMIDLDRDFVMARQRTRSGFVTHSTTNERRVLEAREIGGCWIPTKWEARGVEAIGTYTNSSSRSVGELTDISTSVPESEFAPLGQPGDKVSDGNKSYVIGPSGKWKLIPLAKPLPQSPPQLNVKPVLPESHPPTLKILAVAVALVIGVEVVLLIRRSRRRPGDYWGPPGQGPSGPKP